MTITLGIAFFCGIASLLAGFIDSIAGGGGLLTIPALLICGLPPHIALGTNKIGACLGTMVALWNFAVNKLVHWRMVIYGLAFSLIGSWGGSLLALAIPPQTLGKALLILLPCGMVATILPYRKSKPRPPEIKGWKFWLGLPLVCFAIGLYDGFFGPATGSFLILGLHWILGMGLVAASGTAKAFNLGSNLSAGISFIWHGQVFWPLSFLMAACLMTGNWLGSAFAIRIGARAVRRFLLLSLLLLLLTLIWQYFVM